MFEKETEKNEIIKDGSIVEFKKSLEDVVTPVTFTTRGNILEPQLIDLPMTFSQECNLKVMKSFDNGNIQLPDIVLSNLGHKMQLLLLINVLIILFIVHLLICLQH